MSEASFKENGLNHYERLNIAQDADQADIKKAFRKLAKVWHPDRHNNKRKRRAAAKFKRIKEAYHTLVDPEKRKNYDSDLKAGMPSKDCPRCGGSGYMMGGPLGQITHCNCRRTHDRPPAGTVKEEAKR